MRKGKKIILDTNIWVSYIVGRKLDAIAKLIFDHNLIVFSCTELEEELGDVLARDKFKNLLYSEPGHYLDFVQNLTTSITISGNYQGCPDAKDNFLFDLAIQSQAELVVTGDKLLLDFEVQNIKVISFKDFRELFGD
ncbi:putative toxin-antitoxin system toxin component, PIN family [Pleomorphovibrio marinus]|uniref:putative toxin-antitoxin system toxin component, PIN family n=1 Tax=Pleomorphovibrio marinus TaxID=2164132 RepID=UPI000E0B2DCD|nr:putative toxin-antitoxin system toxin component, PIN family [Pleomorphovibrio marinus]